MKKSLILLSLLLSIFVTIKPMEPTDSQMNDSFESGFSSDEDNHNTDQINSEDNIMHRVIIIRFINDDQMHNFVNAINGTELEEFVFLRSSARLNQNPYISMSFNEPKTKNQINHDILQVIPNFNIHAIEYH